MLQYYERVGDLGTLLKYILEERPDPQLAQIYARQPSATPRVKIELVIRNAVTENAQDIKSRIVQAMGWQPDDVGIIIGVPGSLKLLLSVPADKVPALMSLARDPQSWLPYEVESITPYEQLPPADQQRWRKTVLEKARPIISPSPAGLGSLSLVKGIIILIAATVLIVVVIGFLRAPHLEIVNACPVSIGIPQEVPVVGGTELSPDSRLSVPIPNGRYLYVYNGEAIDIDANRRPIFFPVGNIDALINGDPLRPGEPHALDITWGDHILVEILRCR